VTIERGTNTPTQRRVLAHLRVLIVQAKDRGHTQTEIAHAAGLHPSYVSLLLRGRRPITLAAIEALAPILDTSAEAILMQEGSQARPIPDLTAHASTDGLVAALRLAVARIVAELVQEMCHDPSWRAEVQALTEPTSRRRRTGPRPRSLK
jgi:transcriptional regulator with XRE-family HTH domain